MSTPDKITIPDEAVAAALRQVMVGEVVTTDSFRAAVAAAAPLIVAAELSRLARELERFEESSRALGFTNYAEGKADGISIGADHLRKRIADVGGFSGVSADGGEKTDE